MLLNSPSVSVLPNKAFKNARITRWGARKRAPLNFALGQKMLCNCANLPSCVSYGGSEEEFCSGFKLVSEREWLRLYQCCGCNKYWQLDVDGRSDFAIKVSQPEMWGSFDDRPYRREFFIKFHGGEGTGKCSWARCNRSALQNMAICVDHAYPEFSCTDEQP